MIQYIFYECSNCGHYVLLKIGDETKHIKSGGLMCVNDGYEMRGIIIREKEVEKI